MKLSLLLTIFACIYSLALFIDIARDWLRSPKSAAIRNPKSAIE